MNHPPRDIVRLPLIPRFPTLILSSCPRARAHKVFAKVVVSYRVALQSGWYASEPYPGKTILFFERQRISILPHICRFFGSCVHKCLQQWFGSAVISSRTYPSLYVL